MKKATFRQDVIEKVLSYGKECAIARNRGEKFPRPSRTIHLILHKYQIRDVDVFSREMKRVLNLFGGSLYYYYGEFEEKPSRRFMVELLQRTEFFRIIDLLEGQISEKRFYPDDSQIWLEIPQSA